MTAHAFYANSLFKTYSYDFYARAHILMANFETHLLLGVASGTVFASAGLYTNQIQPVEGVAVVALATISGCLPDIDKTGSKPSQFLTHFLSFVMPIVLLLHFKPRIGPELWANIIFYIFFCAISYFLICPLIARMTKHRGVMHTIPFGVLCGELTYLFFTSDYQLLKTASKKMPLFLGTAVFVGYFTHLAADEFYSLYDVKKKKIRKKASFGSALTMYSRISTPRANFTVYLLVALVTFVIRG